ncbi:MBL fold metallo-hydrolase [Ferrimonas pelagia]|uniref:MBL fold metallo-hydrolase n=1 Tax=Ferrimonas pelagia TaxID=1177826 RepID=A0ABP9EJW7_9GAMM
MKMLHRSFTLLCALCSPLALAVGQGQISVSIAHFGDVTVHSLTAPEDSSMVSSHVVESDQGLVLIDGQFLRPYAKQFRDYVDGLDKPMVEVLLSHHHPDHWMGLEYFPDVKVAAQQTVIDNHKRMAPVYLKQKPQEYGAEMVIDYAIEIGRALANEETIAGLRYEFTLLKGGEAPAQTLIALPDLGVMFVQDMVSSEAHAFFGARDLATWRTHLTELEAKKGDQVLFTGHGLPVQLRANAILDQIAYLETAERLREQHQHADYKTLKAAMIAAHPELKANPLADIASKFYIEKVAPMLREQRAAD